MQLDKTKPITKLLLEISFAADGTGGGRVECEYLPFAVPFYSIADLIGEMDRICDYLEFPQAWENRRRLVCEPKDREAACALTQARWKKKRAGMPQQERLSGLRFHIQIYCRQHVSLQGLIQYEKERIAFRSALELQGLITDTLENKATARRETRAGCALHA